MTDALAEHTRKNRERQRAAAKRDRWEYTIVQPRRDYHNDDIEQMNALGGEGWELVALRGNPLSHERDRPYLYFKRKVRS